MKKLLSLLLLSTMILAACGSADAPDAPDTPDTTDESDNGSASGGDSQLVTYGVAGTITSLSVEAGNDNGVLGSIMVEGPENNGADYQVASVTVTEDTVIYINDEVSFDDLEEGQYVNVFLNDEVMESYPVQATAYQINIVPDEPAPLDTEEE